MVSARPELAEEQMNELLNVRIDVCCGQEVTANIVTLDCWLPCRQRTGQWLL